MTSSPIDRLIDAINAHDLEAVTACFTPSYSVVWPVHPERSSTGQEHVRGMWQVLFPTHPTIRATTTARVHSGDEVWAEWEFTTEPGSGPQFNQRGVIICVVEGDLIAAARFYMETVDAAAG